ncbi:MAG: sodium:proton antiporter [Deltaproteobacteria bacterium]|nr:MAG: sodium:proton antiporter [Deltaproteobacteria bacterium]
MKRIGLLIVLLCGGVFLFYTMDFPGWGDVNSPASTHLSPYYITHAESDMAVPNLVSAVLADYRGYDTLFETAVIFSAGLACFFLLRVRRNRQPKIQLFRHLPTGVTLHIEAGGKLPPEDSAVFKRIDSDWTPHDTIIMTSARLIIPFIQLFGLYVVAHGHHSPGGGFQGGVILGASIILYALTHDLRGAIRRVSERFASVSAALGVLIYAGTGALCMLFGADFLNYSALAPLLGGDPVMARSHGILMIEVGVALAVMAVMIWIYYNLSSSGKHDEGL